MQSYWWRWLKQAAGEIWRDAPFGGSPMRAVMWLAGIAVAIILPLKAGVAWPAVTLATAGAIVTIAILAFVWKLFSIPPRWEKAANNKPIALTAAEGAPVPDWPISELFFHIRPDVLEAKDGKEVWLDVAHEIKRAFAVNGLVVWGVQMPPDAAAKMYWPKHRAPPRSIEPVFWQGADFTYNFFPGDESSRWEAHTTMSPNGAVFADLQVNKAQALRLWPEPDLTASIYLDCVVSGYGVESLTKEWSGIKTVAHNAENAKAVLTVYFHRPMHRYFVTPKANDPVFWRVREQTPDTCTFEIRSANAPTDVRVLFERA